MAKAAKIGHLENMHNRPSERIARLTRRYQTQPLFLSVQRARYYTEYWRKSQGQGVPLAIRIAKAVNHVYENMGHCIDPDDRIAGCWTERFLGVPIDIERGVYNSVFAPELDKLTLAGFRAESFAKGLAFMFRTANLGAFLKNQKHAKSSGSPPLNFELKTMSERRINPYRIDPRDKKELLDDLLPYWKGKTVVDEVERRLAESGLLSAGMRDLVTAIPGSTSRQVVFVATCAAVSAYQGHTILDYDKVLRIGLEGLSKEIRKTADDRDLPTSQRDFLRSIEIAVEGVMIFADRLAESIDVELHNTHSPSRRKELQEMLESCRRVPRKRARNFREAVQCMWTMKTAVDLAHPLNLNCLGRLDQNLQPFYEKDLKRGAITPYQASELVEELLLKLMTQNVRPESNVLGNFYHRYLGSTPITIGGLTPDGRDATNDMTHICLRAAHNSKAITNVSVRVHEDTLDDLLREMAGYMRQGTSSFALFNDRMHIRAMQRRGFSEADARDYAIMGCVEATCPGKTGEMSANALTLARLLDTTLRNGDSATMAGMVRKDGLPSGDPDRFQTFEQFLDAFCRQADHFIEKIARGSNLRDEIFASMRPTPHLSAFIDGCIDHKTDQTRGGARYDLSGLSMINSIANLTDSLLAIEKLVFEQKRFTIRQLIRAVDDNFQGHDEIARALKDLEGKWGNGCKHTDELARRIAKRLFDSAHKGKTFKGGPFVVYVISMITHTVDGRLSIAGFDGRKAATPFAASCNPYNVEKNGCTAALRSVAALPFEDVMGAAVNMRFHPSAIGETDASVDKWIALVRTYFQLGGSQIQPTVVSAEMLRKACEDPDSHRDLIVKVGGYSTYFTDLGDEIKQEIIARTEHGMV